MSKVFAIVDGKGVREISVEEICRLQDSSSADKYVLVDVRSQAEINVSTIPGAMTREELELSMDDFRDHVAVVFCTIGGRSLLYARQLSQRGVDSRNFKAGIIGWCEAGLSLTFVQSHNDMPFDKRFEHVATTKI